MQLLSCFFRLRGPFDELEVIDHGSFEQRNYLTLRMIAQVLDIYRDQFKGKFFDLRVFTGDNPEDGLKLGMKSFLSYSTLPGHEDRILAIPDFSFYAYPEIGIDSYEKFTAMCLLRSKKTSSLKDRLFWIGNVRSIPCRHRLVEIGASDPGIYETIHSGELPGSPRVRIADHSDYRYLIDVPGFGWSVRTKYFFFMGRPVLISARPFREFYYDHLVPYVHYLPIKDDLSDLDQSYRDLRKDRALQKELSKNARIFARQHLTREKALLRLRDVLLTQAQ